MPPLSLLEYAQAVLCRALPCYPLKYLCAIIGIRIPNRPADVLDIHRGHGQDVYKRQHLIHGTTGICPTTLTCSDEELFTFFESFRQAREVTEQMPHLLGIHLEGPYFSPAQAGAQPPKYLVHPRPEHYHEILRRGQGNIVRWSAAPELPGALELGDELAGKGIKAVSYTHLSL